MDVLVRQIVVYIVVYILEYVCLVVMWQFGIMVCGVVIGCLVEFCSFMGVQGGIQVFELLCEVVQLVGFDEIVFVEELVVVVMYYYCVID